MMKSFKPLRIFSSDLNRVCLTRIVNGVYQIVRKAGSYIQCPVYGGLIFVKIVSFSFPSSKNLSLGPDPSVPKKPGYESNK
jgi:hypothetical protein